MSAPGRLTPAELAPVGNDQMLAVCAQWFYRADDALNAAFGFRMRILSPYGAYRTLEQNVAIGGSAGSQHLQGRAIDIDNQRTFRNANEALFLKILGDNGFYNQQINGAPFPSEPWHFRNMLTTAPAGSGGTTPIPGIPGAGGTTMYLARDVVNGSIWLITDNGRAGITTPAHVTLIQRIFKSYPNYDNFYGAELDIVQGYILAAQQGDDAETAKVLAAIAAKTIDPAPIAAAAAAAAAAAVNKALEGQDITVEVDYDKIAAETSAATEKALQDEFAKQQSSIAAIPDAVADEQAERLKS